MGNETDIRTRTSGTPIWKGIATAMAVILSGVLGYLGKQILDGQSKIQDQLATQTLRIQQLEDDRSKWGTLAEQEHKLVTLRETSAYDRGRIDVILSLIEPLVRNEGIALEAPEQPERPPVELRPRVELPVQRVDPDAFRNAQQQKYDIPKKK